MLLSGGCATSDPGAIKGRHVVVRTADPAIPPETMTALAQRGDRVFAKLGSFFGRSIPEPVLINLGTKHPVSKSYADKNTIGFPKSVVDRNIVIIAHEMTHLFMPEHHLEALREGIAVYAQDRFGEVTGYPNYGVDLDQAIRSRLKKRIDPPVYSFSTAETFFRRARAPAGDANKLKWKDINQADRRNAYLLGGSFARYLLEVELHGDMARFRQLYMTGDVKSVTGKEIAEIEAAWLREIGLKRP